MMILNLFLRPGLLIIGFLASLMLAYPLLDLLNLGFYTLVRYAGFDVDALYGHLVIIFAYVAIAVSMLKKCFDVIHALADRVLLWIGDRTTQVGGSDEALQSSRQGVDTGTAGVRSMGEGYTSSMSGAAGHGRQLSEHNNRKRMDNENIHGKPTDGGGSIS